MIKKPYDLSYGGKNVWRGARLYEFQLTKDEHDALTSQIAMSNKGRGGRCTLLYTFTEHGAVMAAIIL